MDQASVVRMQTQMKHAKTRSEHGGKTGKSSGNSIMPGVRGCSFEEVNARSQTETTVMRRILELPSAAMRRHCKEGWSCGRLMLTSADAASSFLRDALAGGD
jgi:hypothetical protein